MELTFKRVGRLVGGFVNSGKEPPGEEDRESSAGEWAKHQFIVEPPGGVKGKGGCLVVCLMFTRGSW